MSRKDKPNQDLAPVSAREAGHLTAEAMLPEGALLRHPLDGPLPEAFAAPLPGESPAGVQELRLRQIELEMQNNELRRALAEVDAQRTRYTQLYERAPVGFLTLNALGQIQHGNLRAAALLGVAQAALVNQPLSRFLFPEDHSAYSLGLQCLSEEREVQVCQLRMLRPDGSQFWARLEASTSRGADGLPEHHVMMSDSTQGKAMEAALQRSEAEFRKMFELSAVGCAQSDPLTGRLLRVNRKLCEITGYEADELLAMSVTDITHPDDRAACWQGYLDALAGTDGHRGDKRYVRKSGESVWVNVQVTLLRDDRGQPLLMLGVIQDITVRKEAEAALRDKLELQGWLSKIAATVPGVICSFKVRPDGSLCIPYASAALERVYGLQPEEVREDASPLLERIHPGDLGYVQETIAASAATLTPWRAEFRVRHPQRGELWVEGHAMPQREHDDSILWHGFVHDITDRKRMETALRDSERLYRAIGESIDYGVWVSAPDGRNLYASESFLQLLGLTQEKYAGFGWLSALHPDEAEHTLGLWMECVRSATLCDIEYRCRGVDGRWHYVLARGMPVRNEQGEIIHWAGINLDISRLKQVEQSLRDNEADLQRAQAVARTGSWRLDLGRNELLWSDENHRLFGIPKGVALTYETFLGIIHPDDRRAVDQAWRAALRGEPYVIEHRIVVEDEVRWVIERAELEFDAQGVLRGGFGSTQDITESRRAAAALEASESRFRLAMEAVSGLVYDWDRQADSAYCSTGLQRLFGLCGAESRFSRRWWRERVHPDDLRLIRPEVVRSIAAGADRLQVEYRMRHGDGHWMHILDSARILRDEAGRVLRVVGSLTDISARKEAEAALRRLNDTLEEKVAARTFEAETRARALLDSERLTRATIDALPSPLCVLNASGHIIAVNKAWIEFASSNGGQSDVLGEGSDYLAVCDLAAVQGCAVSARVAEAIRAALSGRRQDFSTEYECSSPQARRWYRLSLSCFPQGGPLRLVALHEDITERKLAAEEQSESALRLKRLAAHLETVREEQSTTIAREVHDELGGTLTMLKLGLATTLDDLALSVPQRVRVQYLIEQVGAALTTVKRISAGLRPAMLDTLGLIATIKWHAGDFSRLTGIATEVHTPNYVRLSHVRNTAVFRIVQEALTNVAKHAEASWASIVIEKEADTLIVEVRDNGVGLTENYRRKHESFGLIGMHERAQYLGGWLSIVETPEGGTSLTLRIPLEDSSQNAGA